MNRFWGGFFILVPLLGTLAYSLAALDLPPARGWWLPRCESVAGASIDHLFRVVHWVAAGVFVATGVVLGTAVWRFGGNARKEAKYFHTHLGLEITWCLAAAAVLVFLALYQMNSWAENKRLRPTQVINGETVSKPPLAKVVAKRFGWEFFHAGADGRLDTPDDIYVENLLIAPCDEEVVLQLESRDVIHSFFVPNLRLKQDVVPGMTQFVWFRGIRPAEMEIVCAELCGWGHYSMQARLQLVPRSEYDRWLDDSLRRKRAVTGGTTR